MRARPTFRTVAAVLMAIAAAGCGGTAPLAGDDGTRPTNGSKAELEALYRARLDSARTRFTEADVRFMTDMIVHHAQAVVMSALAPTHGASAEVQTLAARIDNAQEDEIATMKAWLRDRGQTVPEIHIEGTHIMVHGAGNHAMHADADRATHMPGMLTQKELQELDEARGAAFDRLFLEFMIRHHGGAVTMVDELFSIDGAVQDEAAFKLASDIQVDQITEIERMERMLEALSHTARDP